MIESAAAAGAPSTQALPRLVIAAPASGHGKTTVASGLMAALVAEGLEVAAFKVGPDYIDPGYHALATGRPGRNLDPHLCSPGQMVPLLMHGCATPRPADVSVVEGVMGLFDGQLGGHGFASTAHVAGLIQAPVVLVVDISQVSRTAAAIVHGLNTFDPGVRLGGVILNKAGSARHADEICAAMESTGIEVFGILPRDAGIEAPSRHLGLVPAAEREDAAGALARLAGQVGQHLELTRVLALAHTAPALTAVPWSPTEVVSPPSPALPVVAVAGGRAFTFRYAETEELLRAAGCRPVVFDPLTDTRLPEGTAGLYLGGGFPEVHAVELAANTALRADIAAAVQAGVPTVAECAGLLYLCDSVDGHAMAAGVPATGRMTPRLTLGYRTVVAEADSLLAPAGTRVTGHEFHRTTVEPPAGSHSAWLHQGVPAGFSADPAGLGQPTLHASYLHAHWAGHPQLAQRFSAAVHAAAERGVRWAAPSVAVPEPEQEPDLLHHGDADAADGLVDLAVNVRVSTPPRWLADVLHATVDQMAHYPHPGRAIAAIAAAHGVPADHVLPTAGGAEAFTLLARARPWLAPLVVHPQFTEPEAALLAAGHRPRRLLLSGDDHFGLDPQRVPTDADLVMVGNPTNPTSVLHPAATLGPLRRPGRVLCVDEAFMDAVPGEIESMLTGPYEGLVVLRSLTKTWGLAGLRAGYAVGDPAVIEAMRRQQPPWSVSTPALVAIEACLAPPALALAEEAAVEIGERRAVLVRALAELGLPVVGSPAAPFVLVDTSPWSRPGDSPDWLRTELRRAGFAVRRGESFPGLGRSWIRIAVRDEETTRALAKALLALQPGART